MPQEDVQLQNTTQKRRQRRAFGAEYKADVVKLCRSGERTIPEVARDLDLTESSVRRWVEQIELDEGRRQGLTSDERAELARLRRENRVLREERDILKRATAFFAAETR
jgi:transposase